ncbi:unnamed protein product [Allacma fusca]|uniref:Uncharacterized protein n=1 Tax=Allacma fusca TaxID=39272 RepID=A0A8J2KNM7_9HEXA|nr:unnamed protein product [Allacma fusca]
MVQQQVQGIVRQRQLRIERQHQECQETEREVVHKKTVLRSTKSPPPPPPVNAVEAKTSAGSSKWTTLSIKASFHLNFLFFFITLLIPLDPFTLACGLTVTILIGIEFNTYDLLNRKTVQ